MNDLLTIVIPVKNEEKNLPACLENVRDFRNVVVVDSGSGDRTREIFEGFWTRLHNLRKAIDAAVAFGNRPGDELRKWRGEMAAEKIAQEQDEGGIRVAGESGCG